MLQAFGSKKPRECPPPMANKTILYIQYTNPSCYPPLERSSRIFADAGNRVFFWGTRSYKTGHLKFPAHKNIKVYLLPYCPPGSLQKIHFFFFCVMGLAAALVLRPA